ncbi:MAG: zinc ribbon domain-containing protein, partial [Chloroflexota bacterium]
RPSSPSAESTRPNSTDDLGGRLFHGAELLGEPALDQCTSVSLNSVVSRWQTYAGNITAKDQVQQGGHQPILPIELCERVAQVKEQRSKVRRSSKQLRSDHIYLLGGILYCAKCGRKMKGHNAPQLVLSRYYAHSHGKYGCDQKMIKAHIIDEKIETIISTLLQNEATLINVAEKLREVLAQAAEGQTQGSASILDALDRKRSERTRLIDLRVDGLITKDEFTQRQQPLDHEIARLEDELANSPTAHLVDIEPLISKLLDHLASFPDADRATKKDIIRNTFSRIEIQDGAISQITPHTWAAPVFEVARSIISF